MWLFFWSCRCEQYQERPFRALCTALPRSQGARTKWVGVGKTPVEKGDRGQEVPVPSPAMWVPSPLRMALSCPLQAHLISHCDSSEPGMKCYSPAAWGQEGPSVGRSPKALKMRNVSFTLWKKLNALFWPTQKVSTPLRRLFFGPLESTTALRRAHHLLAILSGVSSLSASLGHPGRRRAVLGHTLNTQTLMKTDERKKF